jgi:peptidoglycan/xylan/chitin deacetylase (PgdA/CDA1 family)
MKIPILLYHQIDEPPRRGTTLRGLIVSPASFARQMAMLALLGYKGLSMKDLEPYLDGRKTGKVVGITFDDGYQNNLHNALPVLQKHGFTATCYAVSDMIGGTNVWDKELVAEKPLMTHTDWQAWLAAGMEVGSHTKTHVDLNAASQESARENIAQSKTQLEQALGCEVRHFCYPYGRFRAEHRQMVQDAGYTTATSSRRGRVSPGDDPFSLKRVLVARATTLWHLLLKIATTYEDRRG